MIYALLKVLSQLTVWGYFRRVKIVGKSSIHKTGPYLFLANHPSAFMDPIVVATSVKPSVYFIAAGEYVGKGFKGWFFQKVLHMIPVYRPSTRPEEAHKNKDMFLKFHEHLANQGALLIFPEGVSLTEKKLKPLKMGAARIAIGAELQHALKLNIPIIPIGLNYSDPHQFRSDLFVKIASPIYVRDFIKNPLDFEKITELEAIDLARELTEHLEKVMRSTILHIDTEDDEVLLSKLKAVFSSEVKHQFNIQYDDQEEELEMQKDFLKAIHYYKQKEPTAFTSVLLKVDNYLDILNKNGLSDKDIGQFKQRYFYRRVSTYILGIPFFLFGLINNYIPYWAVGAIANRIKIGETFQGSIVLALGLFIFAGWYTGIAILVGLLGLGWYALFYPILCYVFGLYALVYATAIGQSLSRRRLRKLVSANSGLIRDLIEQRRAIIKEISAVQEAYLAQKSSIN